MRIFRNEVSTVAAIVKRIYDKGGLWIDVGFTPLASAWAFFANANAAHLTAVLLLKSSCFCWLLALLMSRLPLATELM